MNFEKQNVDNSEAKNIKEEVNKKEQIVKDLVDFSVRHDNPITFLDYGLDENSELIKNNEINGKVLEGSSEENTETLRSILGSLKAFLKRPLFTDSMPDDLLKREKWWKNNKEKLNKESQEYYENNRMRLGKNYAIFGYLSYLPDLVIDSKIKNKLLDLNKDIPPELLNDDDNGNRIYVTLSNEKKIEVVEKFTGIIKEVVSVLEKTT